MLAVLPRVLLAAQRPGSAAGAERRKRQQHARSYFVPTRVWDGVALEAHDSWIVVVRGEAIEAVGPPAEVKVPDDAHLIKLPGTTLLPGLIDAHTHVLLHPYDEALWNDQVLKEALALRVCRATNHLRDTLLSGFTTIRDLGTEGAGYADVGLKQAVAQGIILGPHMLVVTRAIVATGSYAPKGFAPEFTIPQGAEEADGVDSLIRVVRDQIGKGADWIKVYADTAMGGAAVRPSFSQEELTRIVETAGSCRYPGIGSRHVEGRGCDELPWLALRPSSMATAATLRVSGSWWNTASLYVQRWPLLKPLPGIKAIALGLVRNHLVSRGHGRTSSMRHWRRV